MKKIHFHQIRFNHWTSIVLIIAALLFVFGYFELIKFEDKQTNHQLYGIGLLLQAIVYSRLFWYKNYVQWTSTGMWIKVNQWLGKYVRFEEVKNVELENDTLKIIDKSKRVMLFRMNNIDANDVNEVVKIIKQNSGIESVEFATN